MTARSRSRKDSAGLGVASNMEDHGSTGGSPLILARRRSSSLALIIKAQPGHRHSRRHRHGHGHGHGHGQSHLGYSSGRGGKSTETHSSGT